MPLLASLGYLASLGQVAELGQGYVHQREQVQWSRRNYHRDVQALTVDLLGAARDDIRGTYDTYVERVNTLLLLNALLLPFAFSILQFSDSFILQTEDQCPTCLEARHPWLAIVWAYLGGLALVLPFWSLLMLFWCKIKTDQCLQQPLEELQLLRKAFVARTATDSGLGAGPPTTGSMPKQDMDEYEEIINLLCNFMVDHQDIFTGHWENRCAPLVKYATWLLWSSSYVAVLLVALMFWIYLMNRHDISNASQFAGTMAVGLLAPLMFFLCRKKNPTPIFPSARQCDPSGIHRDTQQVASCSDNQPEVQTVVSTASIDLASQQSTPRITRRSSGRDESLLRQQPAASGQLPAAATREPSPLAWPLRNEGAAQPRVTRARSQ